MNTIRRPRLLLFLLCSLILLGIFLWQYEPPVELEVNVPVTIANLPTGLIISGQPVKEVEVRVRGVKTILEAFSGQKRSCVLDLSHAAAGLVTLPLDESNLQLPVGVSFVQIPFFRSCRSLPTA